MLPWMESLHNSCVRLWHLLIPTSATWVMHWVQGLFRTEVASVDIIKCHLGIEQHIDWVEQVFSHFNRNDKYEEFDGMVHAAHAAWKEVRYVTPTPQLCSELIRQWL